MKQTSQKTRLLSLLSDFKPHSTIEILEAVYGGSHLGIARCAVRVHDLRIDGHNIEGRTDKENRKIFWYKLIPSILL